MQTLQSMHSYAGTDASRRYPGRQRKQTAPPPGMVSSEHIPDNWDDSAEEDGEVSSPPPKLQGEGQMQSETGTHCAVNQCLLCDGSESI